MAGFRYLDYIVPGVILMSVITNSYANVVSSFFSAKFQRNIEELLVAPVPEWVILVGYVGGGVGRGLMVGAVVMGIAAGFTASRPAHPEIVAAMFILTATLFSLAGFLNAIFANSFDDISIVPNFVLTPLVYLGGVFYSVELLPESWRNLSHLNPILYMVNAFRYGFLGVSDVSVALAFAMTLLLILLLTIVALVILKRGTGLKT